MTRRFLSFALLVDAATLVAMVLVVPKYGPLLADPSGVNTAYVTLVYISFLIGTFLMRKLQPVAPASGAWLSPVFRGVLAGIFGLTLTTVLAWQLGFFESFPSADPMVLGEGEAAAYFVFAPGAWLGVSMLYILFLAFPVNETIAIEDVRYTVFAIIGLISAGLMLAMMVVFGQAVVPRTNPALWFAAGLILLLILFIPPRLLYMSRLTELPGRAATIALVSLAIVAAAGAWLMAAG